MLAGLARRTVGLLAVRQPRPRQGAPAPRARAHGRSGVHHAGRRPTPPSARRCDLIGERPQGLQSYRYPYFTTYVTHLLEAQFGTQATFEGGLQVYTTLDPAMQDAAQDAVTWGIGRAEGRGHRRAPRRARRDPAVDRRDPRDGRRRDAVLADEPVQPRVAGAPPAGLVVQSVRLHRGDRRRPSADHDRRGHAGQLPDGRRHALGADGRRQPLPGRDHAALRARAVAQRRRGEARAGPRASTASSSTRTAWASRRRSTRRSRWRSDRRASRRSIRPPATRRSPTKASTSRRRRSRSCATRSARRCSTTRIRSRPKSSARASRTS